mgnify:CR=1 FL=1
MSIDNKTVKPERITRMDVKVTRNMAVYQSTVAAGKSMDKNASISAAADGRMRNDEIRISSDAMKKQEAAKISSTLSQSIKEGASPERIAKLKGQIQYGSYQVSAEVIAKRLMSGFQNTL